MWAFDKILPIFLSGLLAAVLTQGASFFRDFLVKRDQAKTAAMFITRDLEAFASVAMYRVDDISLFHTSSGSWGSCWVGVPKFPDVRESNDWRSIETKLAMKVLSCEAAVTASQTKLESLLAALDADHTSEDARIECIRVGYQVLCVADEVRKRYKLGARDGDLRARLERRLPDVSKSDHIRDGWNAAIAKTVKDVRKKPVP